MASNALPAKRDRLFALAEDVCEGLTSLETVLGVKQNTEAVLRAALAAARAAENAWGSAQVEKKAATAALNAADTAGRIFITNSRKRLSKFLGETYNAEWGAAGWPDNSTATPRGQEERFSMLASLKAYFTANPAHASVDMETTAELAQAAHTAVSRARTELRAKMALMGAAKAARDVAEANLRLRMNGLVGELEVLLGPEDARWHSFGLNRPADEETPEAPSFTTATPGTAGTLLVDWDDPLRADRYRVWMLIVGTDSDFRAVSTVHDSDATLTGLPSGATVKVRVTSANDAGESQQGPEATAVVA